MSLAQMKKPQEPMPAIQLLLDGCHGIYLPQQFATQFDLAKFNLPDKAVIEYLLAGPEDEEYWDAWAEVLDAATYAGTDGNTYYLYQDGDLWLVCEDTMTEEEYSDFFGYPKN